MQKIVFTEEFCSPENLFPFTLTRQIQDLRVGILTIREKWELFLGMPSFDKQEGDYKDLENAIVIDESIGKDIVYLIHGNIIPTPGLAHQVKKLKPGEFLTKPDEENFIYCISKKQVLDANKIKMDRAIEAKDELKEIKYGWDISKLNATAIELDYELLASRRKNRGVPRSNQLINASRVFVEKGARVEHCIINATEGPVYIGNGAHVMEGSMLRGPLAICEGATVKMGSRIYGGTTIGPYSTVGGEVKNSVFFGYSNKAHDGYVGDSVIGEWCNLGAGTSNSNLKNNASDICVFTVNGPVNVGMKCGMLMGDYSRTAINTSVNTGSVIGVCCNVFGNGLTPKYIPHFSWGSDGVERYRYDEALTHLSNWKKLKGQDVNENEKIILRHIFDHY
jgi:UDP-N-acetylglucosamine diphosphorylase / glucose-1-phosphate thymidylyltransferase / UDP-N-acetylgalactosamine diphosphorylase / glucosamine-1-phosphate N-acetyltransferase / galactosamine-1-phosphate N-acetyltransferase